MAENRRGRDRGLYYLSKGQLFILAVGFAATSVIVFMLGVLIGQGIEERKLLKKEEPLVKLPVKPLPKGAAPQSGDKGEITFYDTLPKAPSGSQPAQKEPAKKEAAAKPAAKDAEVAVKETPAEKAQEKSAAPEKASPAPEVREVKKEAAPAKPAKREKERAQAKGAEKPWTVQINAYPHEWDAAKLAKRLKERGYDAYVTPYTDTKGRNWYRVRVGHLETQQQARELQERLKTKEKISETFTSSRP